MDIDCPQFASVVPITITRDRKRPEVCGSGVMLQLSEGEVLFTAAYVLDLADEGQLCAPLSDRFEPLHGYIWKNSHSGPSRENDPIDIGYCLFPSRDQSASTFRPLTLDDIEADTPNGDGANGYTLVGYPFRKTENFHSSVNTAQQRYTGGGLTASELREQGFDPNLNLAFHFHRRKAQRNDLDIPTMAPHPRAMSGGGLFAWPKAPKGLTELPSRFPLVGIFHTFDEKRSLLIGTRVEYFLAALRQAPAND